MINKPVKNEIRIKRHAKIRNKINGTPEVPRLNVFRSNKHMYAQLIDDVNGNTVAAASTKAMKADLKSTSDKDAAKAVGTAIAKAALEKGNSLMVQSTGIILTAGTAEDVKRTITFSVTATRGSGSDVFKYAAFSNEDMYI